jgi:hypothetical protein
LGEHGGILPDEIRITKPMLIGNDFIAVFDDVPLRPIQARDDEKALHHVERLVTQGELPAQPCIIGSKGIKLRP